MNGSNNKPFERLNRVKGYSCENPNCPSYVQFQRLSALKENNLPKLEGTNCSEKDCNLKLIYVSTWIEKDDNIGNLTVWGEE